MRSALFQHVTAKPAARMRLFCFHYAGGSALIYREWGALLPASIEVLPVELPGRAARMREQPWTTMESVLAELSVGLAPLLDRPFAFFGHSMGALVSFELTRRLRRAGQPGPTHLFVSSHRAPHLPNPDPTTHQLPDPALTKKLRDLGGTPDEILAQPELMRLILPIVRADFAVCDTYVYAEEPPLACPIIAFGGFADSMVERAELEAWSAQTTARSACQLFPGGHLYINEQRDRLLEIIEQELASR